MLILLVFFWSVNHLASRSWSDNPFGVTSVALLGVKSIHRCLLLSYGKQMTKTPWFGTLCVLNSTVFSMPLVILRIINFFFIYIPKAHSYRLLSLITVWSCLKHPFPCADWSELTCRWIGSWMKGCFLMIFLSLKEFQWSRNKTFFF